MTALRTLAELAARPGAPEDALWRYRGATPPATVLGLIEALEQIARNSGGPADVSPAAIARMALDRVR